MINMAKKYQHFAINSTGQIINIQDADKKSDIFLCPHCGGEMIAKQGDIREWHFAHKNLTNICTYETYLHSLAKTKFYDRFYNAKNIFIQINTPHRCHKYDTCKLYSEDQCCLYKPVQFNLKKYYDLYKIEKSFNNFRADIFIGNTDNKYEPVFVEIFVSHACEEKKLNSNIRIIELNINSEDDIEEILSQKVLKESHLIRFHNFKPQFRTMKRIRYPLPLKKFILFNSGKVFCDDTDCQKYKQHRLTSKLELTVNSQEYLHDDSSLYQFGYLYANKLGIDIVSCNICRFHKKGDMLDYEYQREKPIFCCLYKRLGTDKYCHHTAAKSCSGFRILSIIQRNELEEKYKSFIVDVWSKK